MIICMVLMMRMMGHGHGSHGVHSGEGESHGQRGGAERILAERLARGEIDIDEYERRLAALRATTNLGRTKEVRDDG
jgi:putative membrane protein